MRTSSLDSYSSSSSLKEALNFHLTAPEVQTFEAVRRKIRGILEKKSSGFMVGWQKRYFKIRCTRNFLLSYHKIEKKNEEPQGILNIGNIKKVASNGDKKFTIDYDGSKKFEIRTKSKNETKEWVDALNFLMDIKDKIGNVGDERSSSINSYFSTDSPIVEESQAMKNKNKKSYLYSNVGKDELMGIMSEEDSSGIIQGTRDHKQSESILKATGIYDYISNIPENLRNSRVMYGFLDKPNRTRLKIPKKRWVFLISSRPLSQEAYLQDQEEISEDELPPLTNFNTLYYYKTGYNVNEVVLAGEIEILKMENVQISSDQKSDSHSFTIDAKGKKYQFISNKRYIIEQWVDAIELSAKTAKEKLYSITGKIKNISMIVTKFEMDRDKLTEELLQEVNRQL